MGQTYHVVKIQEEECIGCTKCIRACPVDAIVGALGQMHSILTDHCIGCDLCLPPCPTQCITRLPTHQDSQLRRQEAQRAKMRHQAKQVRLKKEKEKKKTADLNASAQVKTLLAQALSHYQQKRK